jgi:hypothetical protein
MKGGIMSENQMAKTMSLTAIKKRMLEEIRLELSKQKSIPMLQNSKSMKGMSLHAIKNRMSEEITTSDELLNILNKKTLKPDTPPASITYEMLLNENLEEDDIRPTRGEPTTEEKERLRLRWWKAWYYIMVENNTEDKQQGGGGIDFEKAKYYLINKINKNPNNITDEIIWRWAKEALESRTVKSKKKRLPTNDEFIRQLLNDEEIINLFHSGTPNLLLARTQKLKIYKIEAQTPRRKLNRNKKSRIIKEATAPVRTPKTPKAPVILQASAPAAPAQISLPPMTTDEIDTALKVIKIRVLDSADDSHSIYNETTKDRFKTAFENAVLEPKSTRNAYKHNDKYYELDNDFSSVSRNISYTQGGVRLYKINDRLHLYGMQLPPQFNRMELLESMLYLIDIEKIYSIVDLQDCSRTNINHPDLKFGVGCNPYDTHSSHNVYNSVMNAIVPDMPKKYHRITNYFDMSPGCISAWEQISKIPKTTEPNNSVVVHCLMGKGRTGSVILYLFMRDNLLDATTINRLAKPHFGYHSIDEFIYTMNNIVFNDASTYTYRLSKQSASREIFKVASPKNPRGISVARLFRQRFNRIVFFLAMDKGVSTFYNYAFPSMEVRTYNDEFSEPTKIEVDWHRYDTDDVYENDKRNHKVWFGGVCM